MVNHGAIQQFFDSYATLLVNFVDCWSLPIPHVWKWMVESYSLKEYWGWPGLRIDSLVVIVWKLRRKRVGGEIERDCDEGERKSNANTEEMIGNFWRDILSFTFILACHRKKFTFGEIVILVIAVKFFLFLRIETCRCQAENEADRRDWINKIKGVIASLLNSHLLQQVDASSL